jgi:hypothetical protein
MCDRRTRILLILLFITIPFLSAASIGDLKIIVLRVEFIPDKYVGTSGDGTFLLGNYDNKCSIYTIDPPPHDKSYFESQLIALDSYFRSVSKGHFGIDLNNSAIYPDASESAYTLNDSMAFYNPFLSGIPVDESTRIHEERLVSLFKDAVEVAYNIDNINFSEYDLIVVIHAGVSQDFDFSSISGIPEPAQEDIPSTYIDRRMVAEFIGTGGIQIGGNTIDHGLILPETQNHLFYPEMVDYLDNIVDVCDFQFGLTGTFAMFVGQAIGLPPLWNTETGESGIGVFGLMDQGANNGRGLIPAPPTAWTRIFAGWEEPLPVTLGELIDIESRPDGKSYKIQINAEEYFLIENRTNWFRSNVSIDSVRFAVFEQTNETPLTVEIIFDSVGVNRDENGVVVSVPDYDIGLPGSGLLIWHVDEAEMLKRISSNAVNNMPGMKGLDLEEADGPQDIGYPTNNLFVDLSSGYFSDMWFQGNLWYYDLYPEKEGLPLEFTPFTYPNTGSNNGALSFYSINDIGRSSDTMSFTVSNSRMPNMLPDTSLFIRFQSDLDGDGTQEFIGGRQDLWWSRGDLKNRIPWYHSSHNTIDVLLTQYDSISKSVAVLEDLGSNLKVTFAKLSNDKLMLVEEYIIDHYDMIPVNVSGHPDSNKVLFPGNKISVKWVNEISGSSGFAEIVTGGGILINSNPILDAEIDFRFLSVVDVDQDGMVEIIAVDHSGTVHAFNEQSVLVPGFPIALDADFTVLASDIVGDHISELITQDMDGDIHILNAGGESLLLISNSRLNSLIGIGQYGNHHCLITQNTLFIFDELNQNQVIDSWTYDQGNPARTGIFFSTVSVNNSEEDFPIFNSKETYAYPNPASGNFINIRVQIGRANKVKISIYDVAGYFIENIDMTLINTNSPSEVVWDIRDVEAGIYFAKIHGEYQETSKDHIIKIGVIR